MKPAAILILMCLWVGAAVSQEKPDQPSEPLKMCSERNPPPCVPVAPKLLKEVDPQYPKEARKKQLEGAVYLSGIVGIDGKLTNIKVLRGSLGLGCSQAAIDAVKQWRFKPGQMADGRDVPVLVDIQVSFRLHH